MKQVNVYDARGQLSKLLEEAEAGADIVIARNGKPIVRLVPVNPPRRTMGRWAGQVPAVTDEQWAASDAAVAELFARTTEDDE
jgi:prevent-host-death family protein